MRITKTQLRTAIKCFIDAGEYGVHTSKLALITQYKYPLKLVEKLKQQGFLFRAKHMVAMGNQLGSVYTLLEHHPRRQMEWKYDMKKKDQQPTAWQEEVDTSPQQRTIFNQ